MHFQRMDVARGIDSEAFVTSPEGPGEVSREYRHVTPTFRGQPCAAPSLSAGVNGVGTEPTSTASASVSPIVGACLNRLCPATARTGPFCQIPTPSSPTAAW